MSGGEDGIVRIWSRKLHTLITQITVHKKQISKVFPDMEKPNWIHSCSHDKAVHTHDLKTDKKVILHQAKNGIILDMAQRKDSELELGTSLFLYSIINYLLVTCGINTPILFWDCDVVDSVDQIDIPLKIYALDISPSGKYMAVGTDTAEV